MHLSRDTHNLLNESIRSVSPEEYDILTEEQFNEAYEDYIDFLIENYTDEELENMTEEELMEGFLSRVTGAMGTAKEKIKTGIKAMGKTWDDMKTQYQRGAAGELTWTGAEKYPVKKEEEKPEPKSEEKPEPKSEEKPKPRSTGRGIIPVRPSALDKSTKDIPMGIETDDEKKVAPEKTEKPKKKPNYLGVKSMKRGDIDSTYERVWGKQWKARKNTLERIFKEKGIKKNHFQKLHTHYLSMRGLGDKKVGAKHREALKNLFERKQYYRELVQRLLENYKK
jgi:hypothetical protein